MKAINKRLGRLRGHGQVSPPFPEYLMTVKTLNWMLENASPSHILQREQLWAIHWVGLYLLVV